MNSQRHLLIGLAGIALGLAANLAPASEDLDIKTRVVSYSDLDLAQPRDAHRLYVRIEQAARAVCDSRPTVDLHRIEAYKLCMKKAISDAVAQVRATQPPERLSTQFGN